MPNVVEALGLRAPLKEALVAVTAAPDWVTVALQPLLTDWLPPKDQVTFQPRVAVVPEFFTVTVAVKPLPSRCPHGRRRCRPRCRGARPPPPPPPEPPPTGSKAVDLMDAR